MPDIKKTVDNERDALLRLRYARDMAIEVDGLVRDMAIDEIETLREKLKDYRFALDDAGEVVWSHINEYVSDHEGDMDEGLRLLRKARGG